MSKLRLLFVKEGPAAYISNLDLLRTVQRAFPRTELDIKHSQGFHPHPIISIVLPLPVCQSSDCELLDFEVTQDTDGAGLAEKLNGGLPEGCGSWTAIPPCGRCGSWPISGRRWSWTMTGGCRRGRAGPGGAVPPAGAADREAHQAQAAGGGGHRAYDPGHFLYPGENVLRAAVTVQAQNPGLNPQLLEKAIARYLPELTPDFVRVRRRELLDADGQVFR